MDSKASTEVTDDDGVLREIENMLRSYERTLVIDANFIDVRRRKIYGNLTG